MKRNKRTALGEVGSGNVFADLGLPHAGYLQRRALAGMQPMAAHPSGFPKSVADRVRSIARAPAKGRKR